MYMEDQATAFERKYTGKHSNQGPTNPPCTFILILMYRKHYFVLVSGQISSGMAIPPNIKLLALDFVDRTRLLASVSAKEPQISLPHHAQLKLTRTVAISFPFRFAQVVQSGIHTPQPPRPKWVG